MLQSLVYLQYPFPCVASHTSIIKYDTWSQTTTHRTEVGKVLALPTARILEQSPTVGEGNGLTHALLYLPR